MNGKLKIWYAARSYGFVSRDDGGGDVFLHVSQLNESGIKRVGPGDLLEFAIAIDAETGKPRAIDLKLLSAAAQPAAS